MVGRKWRQDPFSSVWSTIRQMNSHASILSDGSRRHRAAIAPEIEAAVRAEFAVALAGASPLKRLLVRIAIRREIRRRLDHAASAQSLY